ncbi:hypothetical protein ACIQMJ_09720 [Actinosynnema sp. NPDC091369]
MTSIAAVITLMTASATTTAAAAAAEPRVEQELWWCNVSLDYPHRSHTQPDRVNVHADIKQCQRPMPAFKIALSLYQDEVSPVSTRLLGNNKKRARLVANTAPQENVWFTYRAVAKFTIEDGSEPFKATLVSVPQQICIGTNCPPQPDPDSGRLAATRW